MSGGIKHRFLVFSQIDELMEAANDYEINFMPLDRSPETVNDLYQRIIGLGKYSAEIAAIAYILGEEGLA